ncbi:MAG: hypothetical protein AAF750_17115 [Planctomycetota bacterium]
MTAPRGPVDLLRFTPSDWSRLVQQLEQDPEFKPPADAGSTRPPLDRLTLTLEIQHPGGGDTLHRVYGHWLSPRHAGLIHAGFVYPQSTCQLQGHTFPAHGKPSVGSATACVHPKVPGRVEACRLIHGRVHELIVCFDEELPLAELIGCDDSGETQAEKPVEDKPRRVRSWP